MSQTKHANAECAICAKRDYVTPLHGDKGGPLCCLICIGKWQGEHGRRRRLGRIVIRAMVAYQDGGGSWGDLEKLKLSAMGRGDLFGSLDPLGYLADTASTDGEIIELTTELLADAVKISHPDNHPPERQELARRVTQGLLALQPFVFSAPKPKLAPKPEPRNGSSWVDQRPDKEPSRFPCSDCASTIPCFYCTTCRAEWDKRQQVERDRESAKRREARARRRAGLERKRPPCAVCGAKFEGKRFDARFCSDACRQKAHRKSVTANRSSSTRPHLAVTR